MEWNYENGRIYSTDEKGELMCETTFIRKENGEMDIDYTYVNLVLRGQGVAGKMMEVFGGTLSAGHRSAKVPGTSLLSKKTTN